MRNMRAILFWVDSGILASVGSLIAHDALEPKAGHHPVGGGHDDLIERRVANWSFAAQHRGVSNHQIETEFIFRDGNPAELLARRLGRDLRFAVSVECWSAVRVSVGNA